MTRWDFAGEDRSYLAGESFSNGRSFRGVPSPARSRADVILEAATGRAVLHVGFADHLPLIAEKRDRGDWLHDRISGVATRAAGIDIEADVVAHLTEMGVEDIYAGDLTEPLHEPALAEADFDLVVMGEVLEHVPNPVGFLTSVRVNVGRPGQRLMVTVPNAWSIAALASVVRGMETINTDHRFWFTPYTLAKVLWNAGYDVDWVQTCVGAANPRSVRGKIGSRVTRRNGLLREHVVGAAHIPR